MVHPQISVSSGAAARPPGSAVATGTAFLVGQAPAGGPAGPVLVRSFAAAAKLIFPAGRPDPVTDNAKLYDALFDAFRAGLGRAYVSTLPDMSVQGAVAAALASFGPELGCGQVFAPDADSSAEYLAVITHAAASNRTPLVQLADGTADQLATSAAAIITGTTTPEIVGMFGSWVVVPGYVAGTTRVTPLAAIELGLIAATDAHYGDAAHAAGFDQGFGAGRIRDALGLVRTFSTGDLDIFHDTAHVNVAVTQPNGAFEVEDFISASGEPGWDQLNYQRYRMSLVERGRAALRPYQGRSFGEPHIFTKAKNDLEAILAADYVSGALFTEIPPSDAFSVDTAYGPGLINNPTTVSAHTMAASIDYVPAGHISSINLLLTSEGVSA